MSKKKIILTLFVFAIILCYGSLIMALEPTDISNHWAQDYILNLTSNDILKPYPDGTFKPDKPITRGEFALALAKQLNVVPDNNNHFKDLQGYPAYNLINRLAEKKIINGYPDGTFRPDKSITRAEVVAIIMKSLGINKNEHIIQLRDYHPFEDVPRNHWALNHIKLANKLNLVTGDHENHFNPNNNTTRAEAAKLLTKLDSFSSATGYITDVYPTSKKISINLLNGQRKVLNFDDGTLVGRNNRLIDLDSILKTDKVFIISNTDQEKVAYIKAYGIITQEDLATEVSIMTKGVFEPGDVKSLADGNLSILKPKVQKAVKEQLLSQGLTVDEVNAIISTNWNKLEELSKSRLAEAVAIQTGLPLDITRGLMQGDWEKIKSYAQIEIIQRLVQEVLNSDLLS